ncbi:MAG: VanZ family protein [Oscillospiraceae bacterium]|nr:VanZ family protein [Oscillospiraceae bacterium]
MQKTQKIFLSGLLFALAAVSFLLYFALEINASFILRPLERILLLGAGCAGVYSGALIRAKLTLEGDGAAMIMRRTFAAFFAIYILLILTFTLFDDAFGRNEENSFIFSPEASLSEILASVNLTPFKTIKLYIRGVARGLVPPVDFAVNMLGNLLAFAPMAFFLPLLFESQRKWYRTALSSALAVCLIELLQLVFQKGSCDIDDLILNVAGVILFYFIFWTRRAALLIDRITCGARYSSGF